MTTSLVFQLQQEKSPLRKKLLSYFFTNPEAKHYLRDIALRLHVDPANLSRELRRLVSDGVFISERQGNLKYFSLNGHHPLYQELKSMIFKTVGVQGALKKIMDQFSEIELASICGSDAKGGGGASSDIDLMVVGSPDRNRLASEIKKLESKLGRAINFNLCAPREFRKKQKEKGGFLQQVVKGKKIMLKGVLR